MLKPFRIKKHINCINYKTKHKINNIVFYINIIINIFIKNIIYFRIYLTRNYFKALSMVFIII